MLISSTTFIGDLYISFHHNLISLDKFCFIYGSKKCVFSNSRCECQKTFPTVWMMFWMSNVLLLCFPRPRGARGDEHHLHTARALELRRVCAARPLWAGGVQHLHDRHRRKQYLPRHRVSPCAPGHHSITREHPRESNMLSCIYSGYSSYTILLVFFR